MLENLLSRLMAPEPKRLEEPDARLALAALMVRVARSDGEYSQTEMTRIDRILALRHALTPFAATELRSEAEALEAEAPDTVRFTRALKSTTETDDRMALLQAMWSVVLADGSREAEEDSFLRLVAKLLGVTDVESALARQRAQQE